MEDKERGENDEQTAASSSDQSSEIERLRKVNSTLRRKYQEATQEIKTLTKENDSNKTELLDIIRMQEKDIKFNERLVQIMLNESDLYKLRQRSTWDEDTRDWSIPLFILSKIQDDAAFPTIGAKARVEQSRDERQLQFPDEVGHNLNSNQGSRSRSKYMRDNYSDADNNG